MKLATVSLLAVLAATPALAQAVPDSDNSQPDPNVKSLPAVPALAENPNVDSQTAAADSARQDMKAAKAQSKIDSAKADHDAEPVKANGARQDKDSAQDSQ
jgi:hypothetical protein